MNTLCDQRIHPLARKIESVDTNLNKNLIIANSALKGIFFKSLLKVNIVCRRSGRTLGRHILQSTDTAAKQLVLDRKIWRTRIIK